MALIVALFYEYVQYSRRIEDARYEKYDFSTCTAADYSVRVNLTDEWYDKFLVRLKNKRNRGEPFDIEMFIQN
jgi:hypothetical protein